MQDNPLGRATAYRDTYDPNLLFTVARAAGRATLGIVDSLPFGGVDLWTAYELSWLDESGRPSVAALHLSMPADSPQLIESKSLKLYLNSFAMTHFKSTEAVSNTIGADLTAACGAEVQVTVQTVDANTASQVSEFPGESIDHEDARCEHYQLNAALLKAGGSVVSETLHSHLLRSLCPVTGQPDTGSVFIEYTGPRIDHAALLAYLVSYRQHADFHELCVERIFCDLQEHCGCTALTVYARYNRRGGIDINPFRSNVSSSPPPTRLWRQ